MILSLDNVSPQLRTLALRLSGREAPRISPAGYALGLVREFGYALSCNGVGFAAAQTRLYLERRKSQDKRSEGFAAEADKS